MGDPVFIVILVVKKPTNREAGRFLFSVNVSRSSECLLDNQSCSFYFSAYVAECL